MRKISFAFVMTVLIGLSSVVNGQAIGLHFPSDRQAAGLAPSEVAGAVGYTQSNWNYADGGAAPADNASGSEATIVSPNTGSLTDSDGNVTGATVEWSSNGTWNTANGTATPDAKLMNGYADAINDDGAANVTFSNIPYSSYDAVVYFGSDGNGRTGAVTDGTSTYSYSTYSADPNLVGGFTQADYLQTTVDTGNPNANYAVFSGLSGASWSVDVLRGSSNSGIHGVQIFGVPEPSSLGLLAIAGLGLMIRRRR